MTIKRLRPLAQWYCDTCGEIIAEPSHGWLEWLHDDFVPHSFRICHHAMHSPIKQNDKEGCYHYGRHEHGSDTHLHYMIGPDGMSRMFSLMDRRTPGEEVTERSFKAQAVSDWVYTMRRMFTPHFEEARMYFEQAEEDGFFADSNEIWPYRQDTLQEVIKKYGR